MKDYTKVKYACYFGNMSQAAVANVTPLLFIPFRELYGISYTLLGMLVLVNFVTQLLIDVVFSVYAHRFNLSKTVKCTPLITLLGMFLFAMAPVLFRNHVYVGLVLGTVISAASGGLVEVLVSPVVAAIPSDNPDRQMSILHALYAWGVVLVVIVSTLFLLVFGRDHWQWLLAVWAMLPLISAVLFLSSELPPMSAGEEGQQVSNLLKHPYLILCLLCIFFGGATECSMAQWSSGYLERAMQVNKVWGDVLGVAMFGLTLGVGRTMYAKRGKNIHKVLLLGSVAATVCYLLVTLTNVPMISVLACAMTGFCVSMLWPGSLIAASERFPSGGVMMFALLAAAGDLGASVGPWFIGRVTDVAMKSSYIASLATRYGLTSEQMGLKCGMLAATIFPIASIVIFGILWKMRCKNKVK